MIEKVSFESAVPSLRRANNINVSRGNYKKNDAVYNTNTYLLASLAGLAVIGVGCLSGRNKNIQKTVRQAVNRGKNAVQAAKDTNTSVPKKAVSTLTPQAEKPIAKPASDKENIVIKHLDANQRKLVSDALDEAVTPEMQAEYNKNSTFLPLKNDGKRYAAQLKANNQRQSQEINTIGTNMPEKVFYKLHSLFPPKNNKQTARIIPLNSGSTRRFSA